LTRDSSILRRASDAAASWVTVMSPSQLMTALARTGNTSIGTIGAYLLPDSHKWGHVMSAHAGFPDDSEG
jgi:hypothetical protein